MTSIKSSKRMYVVKRSGDAEPVYFDKITVRNEQLCEDLEIDPSLVSQKVINSIHTGIRTEELDKLSAETALYMSTHEPDYEVLAKRLMISNLHKKTNRLFSQTTDVLNDIGLLDEEYYKFIDTNREELDSIPNHDRDYEFTYFGFKTLEKSYLNKNGQGDIVERPQHLWLRVATYIRFPVIEDIRKVYEMLSTKKFTHASPTLFNAGLKYSQNSSCFLLSMNDDLSDMLGCLKNAGLISKFSGGIGVSMSSVRSKGSRIASVNGKSDGIIPFLKVWNSLARYVNQGSRRKGAIAIYLEPHHPDIIDFLKIRKNNTKEENQCLDLHNALWIPDLFMKRLEKGEMWSFFDPNIVKGLHDMYGEEYEKTYIEAEKNKLYTSQIPITELWKEILSCQMETGEPYILFKDHVNRKSNQMNRGVIRGSNLCSEILQYHDNDNYAVCNLSSISLPAFVKKGGEKNTVEDKEEVNPRTWTVYKKDNCKWCTKALALLDRRKEKYETVLITPENRKKVLADMEEDLEGHSTVPIIFLHEEDFNGNPTNIFIGGYTELEKYFDDTYFDFEELGKVVETITENMNIVIDKNYYPVIEAERSNKEMRPTGIGVQGLADVFQLMNLSWNDEKASEINRDIFATIYYFSHKKSSELGQSLGSYKYFEGSPLSKGIFQYEMWGVENPTTVGGLLDWSWLRGEVKKGMRNSLLVAQMPTASTSQILGNNESIEPYTSNMYVRNVLSGQFPVINKHLYQKLRDMDLWTDDLVDDIIRGGGSVQDLNIPDRIKEVFRTTWELKAKRMIEMSADRGAYVCQTQSLNCFMEDPTIPKLSSMFMYGWKQGLKTGMYYLRRKPKVHAVKFSLMDDLTQKGKAIVLGGEEEGEEEGCISCSA